MSLSGRNGQCLSSQKTHLSRTFGVKSNDRTHMCSHTHRSVLISCTHQQNHRCQNIITVLRKEGQRTRTEVITIVYARSRVHFVWHSSFNKEQLVVCSWKDAESWIKRSNDGNEWLQQAMAIRMLLPRLYFANIYYSWAVKISPLFQKSLIRRVSTLNTSSVVSKSCQIILCGRANN